MEETPNSSEVSVGRNSVRICLPALRRPIKTTGHQTDCLFIRHANNGESSTLFSPQAKEGLVWWRDNLEEWNGKALVSGSPDFMIETDALGHAHIRHC